MLASRYTLRILNSQKAQINSAVRQYTAGSDPPENTKIEKTINTVTLLGRVGAHPQKKGNEEHPITVFPLATHTNYRYENGETVQKTEWHRVVCFKPGLRDVVLNYLQKGQRVHVTGRITYGEVQDENGNPKYTTAIAADDVIFFQSARTA